MIEIFNLSTGYGKKIILESFNLKIYAGEILSIIGGSGSGKSTLLKCIIGFIPVMKGEIVIDGQEISKLTEKEMNEVRKKIGLVFQHAALFDSMSVFDNIAFPIRQSRGKMPMTELEPIVRERLKAVDIEEHIWKMPDELSGGQQKRVGLARALAESPKILLYDEPTTGLDPITTHEVDQLIKRTRDDFNVTSIVISHDIPSVFDISDRIVFLYNGELVQIGTVAEIRNSEHPYVKKFVQTALRAKK